MPYEIPAPMLAKSVPDVPDAAKVPGGLSYEPKWDGFRALISWDGESVEIGSRGCFPNLVCSTARSSCRSIVTAVAGSTGSRCRSASTPRHPA